MNLETIRPLPTLPKPKQKVNRVKPPSSIYTSPESLDFIRERDKDSDVDFDAVQEPCRGPVHKQTQHVKNTRFSSTRGHGCELRSGVSLNGSAGHELRSGASVGWGGGGVVQVQAGGSGAMVGHKLRSGQGGVQQAGG